MKRRLLVVLSLAAALAGIALTGCGTGYQTINDPNGQFHFEAPDSWQAQTRDGLVALYAAKELPATEDEAFDAMSVSIFSSSSETTTSAAEELVRLVEARAADRAWKNKRIGKPAKTNVGSREGAAVDVTGVDTQGREFAGRAVLVQGLNGKVLIYGVSPQSKWKKYHKPFGELLDRWYWHTAAASPTTETAK